MTLIQSQEQKATLEKVTCVDIIGRYIPVILVGGIISSEVAGLQFVFFPVYFAGSYFMRALCTLPIYFGIIMLTWTWVKTIITDTGILDSVRKPIIIALYNLRMEICPKKKRQE